MFTANATPVNTNLRHIIVI